MFNLFLIREDANTAKEANIQYTDTYYVRYKKNTKTVVTPLLWEIVDKNNFDLYKYMSTFDNEKIKKLLTLSDKRKVEDFMGLIINGKNLMIVVWGGTIHESIICKSLSEQKPGTPNINYSKLYYDTMTNKITDNWCIDIKYMNGTIFSSLEKKIKNKINEIYDIKNMFGMSDVQWDKF